MEVKLPNVEARVTYFQGAGGIGNYFRDAGNKHILLEIKGALS